MGSLGRNLLSFRISLIFLARREGEAIGIERGIETLLRILIKKFGELPPTLREKLRSIHDFEELGQLTDYRAG